MPRKRILDADSAKFSVIVTGKNKKVLDQLVVQYDSKYSTMINLIISTFCDLPEEIRTPVIATILDQYHKLLEELDQTPDSYHIQDLKEKLDSCVNLLKLMNPGDKYEIPDYPKDDSGMKKIKLANGYLIIPKSWIVVNPEKAEQCLFANVMECRHSEKYGVPYFIYLLEKADLSDEMEEDFRSLCRKKWNRFSEIENLEKQNRPVADPDNPNEILNRTKHLESPSFGIFEILEQGSPRYNLKSGIPFGAMIVRTEDVE